MAARNAPESSTSEPPENSEPVIFAHVPPPLSGSPLSPPDAPANVSAANCVSVATPTDAASVAVAASDADVDESAATDGEPSVAVAASDAVFATGPRSVAEKLSPIHPLARLGVYAENA